jgi:hypothetical protein
MTKSRLIHALFSLVFLSSLNRGAMQAAENPTQVTVDWTKVSRFPG